jgi:hypothetical protein
MLEGGGHCTSAIVAVALALSSTAGIGAAWIVDAVTRRLRFSSSFLPPLAQPLRPTSTQLSSSFAIVSALTLL